MTTKRTCEICGKKVDSRGYGPHMKSHKRGNKQFRKNLTKAKHHACPASTNEKTLQVPCSLGGHSFMIEIQLSIAATRLVDCR